MTYRKKLIEVALPLPEINDASAYDKMPGIGPHPKGIHHWWARLPLPTARAVLFASVVDDPSEHLDEFPTEAAQDAERERLFGILREMMQKKLHTRPEVYAKARFEMEKSCGGRLPVVLDPFAGGGSIPLEANRLGFEAHASDLNPVAVLLNKCNLELAPRWSGHAPVNPEDRGNIGGTQSWQGTTGLAADVRYYGKLVRKRAIDKIGDLYPKVNLPPERGGGQASVIAWLWARTVASPNPAAKGKHVPLMGTFWLSSREGKRAWLAPVVSTDSKDGWRFDVRVGDPTDPEKNAAKLGTRAGKAQAFQCILTKTPIDRDYVQKEGKAGRLGQRLVAVVADMGRGKTYLPADADQERAALCAAAEAVNEARSTFLSAQLPNRANITGGVCSAYGLSTWGQLYTDRQLIFLLTASDLIRCVREEIMTDCVRADAGFDTSMAVEYAKAIVTALAFALDRCADFNCGLSTWKPSGEQQMHLFTRQALPMVWDFAEANVLGAKAICWHNAVDITAEALGVLNPCTSVTGSAKQADAAAELNEHETILVSTDPPYYNNIGYATLSDFFYLWLRRTIGDLHRDVCSTLLVPKDPELTASPGRFGGDAARAKEHFESGFRRAFAALHKRMDLRFPLTVYYAFKQNDEEGDTSIEVADEGNIDHTTGWETLLEALISSGFQITATWPVRASQKWRMVAMDSNALASYIVLACRPRQASAQTIGRREFLAELKRELPAALKHLQQGNIAPVDFAQAAIGPGMAVFSRYAKVLETDGTPMSVRTALSLINQSLDDVLAEQEGEFDSDTRWALAWFDQNGFNEGPYGVAETLCTAKNTSVAGMVAAEFLAAKSGKVRLLRRDELPASWDPVKDKRLTIWECTHQLIRALDAGEGKAADLLKKVGSHAEAARDLSYRLYSICERRKWAQDALGYNALVLAWGDVRRLAGEQKPTVEVQGELI